MFLHPTEREPKSRDERLADSMTRRVSPRRQAGDDKAVQQHQVTAERRSLDDDLQPSFATTLVKRSQISSGRDRSKRSPYYEGAVYNPTCLLTQRSGEQDHSNCEATGNNRVRSVQQARQP